MIRNLARLLALLVAGFPLLVSATVPTGLLGLVAGALLAGGITSLRMPLVGAGAVVALIEYVVALLISGTPLDIVGALAFGAALSALVQVTGFAVCFRGAAVNPQVIRDQARTWIGGVAAAAGLGLLVVLAADGLALGLPAPLQPAVSALGVLLAFVGVVGAALGPKDRGPSRWMREER